MGRTGKILAGVLAGLVASSLGLRAAMLEAAAPIARIAFGSCNKHDRPQQIWDAIVDYQPQLWIWLGDNIYGDTEDMGLLREKWAAQKAHPAYSELRRIARVIGIWDDHDYGVNDGGKDYPMKASSQQAFLDFLDVPADDPRRTQEGIYASEVFGPEGRDVEVILLDVRSHRDPPGNDGDILGETQWEWFEKTVLGSNAKVLIIASGTQILPSEHRFEKWSDFPAALERLRSLLERAGERTVVLLSGDRHHAELSKLDPGPALSPLYEVTASGLTHSLSGNLEEPNWLRVGNAFGGLNFGTIDIDWDRHSMQLAIRDQRGTIVQSMDVPILNMPDPPSRTEGISSTPAPEPTPVPDSTPSAPPTPTSPD